MPSEALARHVVNIGPLGTFRASGSYHTRPEDLDKIFVKLTQDQQDRILLYFHGGLVTEASGLNSAEKIIAELANVNTYPIIIVWETGLMETILTRLKSINNTKLFQKLLEYVLKTVGKRLGISESDSGRGITEMSDAEFVEEKSQASPFEHYEGSARGGAEQIQLDAFGEIPEIMRDEITVDLEVELEIDEEEIKELLEEEAPETEEFDKDYLTQEARGRNARGFSWVLLKPLAAVAIRVIKRFVKKRDHGFYPTIVEELLREFYIADFGQWVWGAMKLKANEMWQSNEGRSGEDMFAGAYLLDRLQQHCQLFPNTKIDLVGHSAGAIAICHLLNAAVESNLNLPFRKLVLWAPACTLDLFHKSIVERPGIIEEFHLFNMNDEVEKKDRMIPGIYTRSLLYLVSGILEKNANSEEEVDKPLLGMQRYLQGKVPFDNGMPAMLFNYLSSNDFVFQTYSITDEGAAESRRSTAAKHGDFDDDEKTLNSLKVIVNN